MSFGFLSLERVENMEPICFGGLSALPGEKCQGFVPLGPSGSSFPATLIRGTRPGPVILVSSGIHGSEYVGILAAMELARSLQPEDVRGTLLLFHPVNRGAFLRKLSYIEPTLGVNLNRFYPGSPAGPLYERVCHYMVEEYLSRVDLVVDLHGGDLHEGTLPYVYVPGVGAPEVLDRAMEAARLVRADYIVRSAGTTGFYNYANVRGTPAILIEWGGAGRWSREEVEACKADVVNILRRWGSLEGKVQRPPPARLLTEMSYDYAPCPGVFLPRVEVGQVVHRGQLLAEILDPFGGVSARLEARQHGVLLLVWTALGVDTDDPVFIYGE